MAASYKVALVPDAWTRIDTDAATTFDVALPDGGYGEVDRSARVHISAQEQAADCSRENSPWVLSAEPGGRPDRTIDSPNGDKLWALWTGPEVPDMYVAVFGH